MSLHDYLRLLAAVETIGLDRDGDPVHNYAHLGLLRNDPDYPVILRTELPGLATIVSTAWVGFPPPLRNFETLVAGGRLDETNRGADTIAQAILDHGRLVEDILRLG